MQLTLERVGKTVGRMVHLYPQSLSPVPGAVTVLLGATQAGKTSLMRVMAGLDVPSTGRVVVDGVDVSGMSVRERNVSMVYQQFINYPSMTVFDNIASPLKLRGERGATLKSKVRALAVKLHIEVFLERLPAELSGGQQQRVALARALVKNAPLMLLDEPLVNLDYAMAGTADIGIPNGKPVDEWGIRASADGCHPQGASVSRGGATNSLAAVYALTKYVDWMKKYAPKEASGMTFGEAGPVPAQGQIAQQIFWYTAFTADMTKPGLPVVNADGTPKWRMAPGPNGPYWKQGMQNGYQDVGSWTFFAKHDADKTAAAWLYAQFVTAKTTSLKKTLVGLTPIRESDIQSKAMTDMAPKLGGLVEFYRSPARVAWTPTGTNVPDYPKLAQLWWQNVAQAVTAEKTPQQAMDNLAEQMDQVMARLERAGMDRCAPKLNPKGDPAKYLSDKNAPWKKLANEKPQGQTIAYDQLLNAWKAGRVR
jgi:ABC-type lipoprotein export system ATPase subunit